MGSNISTPPCSNKVSWYISASPLSLDVVTINAVKKVVKYNAGYTQNSPGRENLLEIAAGDAGCERSELRSTYVKYNQSLCHQLVRARIFGRMADFDGILFQLQPAGLSGSLGIPILHEQLRSVCCIKVCRAYNPRENRTDRPGRLEAVLGAVLVGMGNG
ncbi:uncharacterized protein MCYG_00658 [Microsporum canis CBS 113480]|uniref:Alpha-carbonic anhydrase domain-containing protein n=1 Tax=Arthroderma otae (strain ATCC MYA-4605 / CBS 113480) TaxID=554155 RepID=C5FD86_ARTOC|nr:uncharacterized protein MCYG_00658 [Microsporum canis CBS 113480]EEQ27770.1 predicted protein [Microsporum canis CBS 113480]